MIRVEIRKIPKREVSVDELSIDDSRIFEISVVKTLDFTLNR